MAIGIKVCKVCGREYEACHTLRPNNGEFRWQDVACCPEHGAEYLRAIMISRGEIVEQAEESVPETPKKKTRKKKSEAAASDAEKEMA